MAAEIMVVSLKVASGCASPMKRLPIAIVISDVRRVKQKRNWFGEMSSVGEQGKTAVNQPVCTLPGRG
jgi:hypothetical protein